MGDISSVTALSSGSSRPLRGRCRVPGDKSISHRALILGALAVGRTRIRNLLEGDDVLRTGAALKALGARIERDGKDTWSVQGVGTGGLVEPAEVLDFGNSGTGARLLMGAVATHPIVAFFTGDESLRRRPMARIIEPLTRTGARFVARDGGRLPLAVVGAPSPMPIAYTLPVPSAQVKSAVLLAGLNAPGETTVIEPIATRDHTENMLRHFGASVEVVATETGGKRITLVGQPELKPADLTVPGDPSSAAFPVVAALLRPGSQITIEGVGINPLRAGLYRTLAEMGARIAFGKERIAGGERVADVKVAAGALHGIEVPAARAPSMIDEYPVLAVAAAFAKGRTVMHGLGELRVKESDRLAAIADGLQSCGVTVAVAGDTLTVDGKGAPPLGGARVAARLDHRIAMAFLVLGGAARKPVRIDDGETIATSFPGFVDLMNRLGARIAEAKR
ncbi:MAG: 3-phosphoshikimate 1-carboxyvinyltransferase [Alphaproteobacteria bacterium]|nr:3-phosphoshikimate 1-carboxyvinyltransferase [Alphaproteobacteria bacterium]